jgi:hypothetical protein
MTPDPMPHNPYETPRSDVQRNEALPVRPVRGILIGLLIDLGGSILAVAAMTFAYAIYIGTQGASAAEIESAFTSTDPTSALGALHTLAGLGMSYLAGFFCLRISRGMNLRYPMVLAIILLVLTVGTGVAWNLMDLSTLLALAALSFGSTLLGGAVALRARA